MKILYFHWAFDSVGGGEVFANDVGRALGMPVHSIVSDKTNKFNFIDISDHLTTLSKLTRKIRTIDYFTWSGVDVTEFGDFDLILSSGSTVRSLVTPPHIPHVNIMFSTPRWLFDLYHWRRRKMSFGKELIVPFAECMRILDMSANNRTDYYIDISPIIKRRIWKYLKRESFTLYPPIDCHKYCNKPDDDYFLYISRMEIEKRPEEAIQACINTQNKLILIGTGTLLNKLKVKYKQQKNIIFLGYVSEEDKITLLSKCKALIFPAINEDFGISVIESLASGKPVICSNDPDNFPNFLIQDKYGITTSGTSDSISHAIKNMPEFESHDLVKKALEFDYSIFKKKINERMKFCKDDFDGKWNDII